MKIGVTIIVVLTILLSCRLEQNKQLDSNELQIGKSDNDNIIETDDQDELVKIPLDQKININEDINNEPIGIEVTYQLDSLRINNNILLVKAQDIKLSVKPQDIFPEEFEQDVVSTIKGNQVYSWNHFKDKIFWEEKKFKILKADFNFDGFQDIYFMNQYGFAQNTGYEVYIYNQQKKQFIKSELSNKSWSKLELMEEKKRIRLYNHINSSEGYKTDYTINNLGQLLKQRSEATISKNSSTNTYYKIIGKNIDSKWVVDTTIIKK